MMERSNHHLLIGYTKTISSLILHLLAPFYMPNDDLHVLSRIYGAEND